jgi:K+-sensing histidine kinase KdpD
MLSHELRNPLAAVMNATTLIAKQPDTGSVARCQAVIDRQARHMKRLLDNLLDVSRITRGKFQLIVEDLDLRAPIEAAIESTRRCSPSAASSSTTACRTSPCPCAATPAGWSRSWSTSCPTPPTTRRARARCGCS